MTRVLHCVATLRVGGVENRVLSMFDRLAGTTPRHTHALCAFQGGALEETRIPRIEEAGFRVFVVGRRSRFSLRFYRDLRATLVEAQPDIVHAYNPTPSLWTRLVSGGSRPWRVVVHCGGVGPFRSRLLRTIERALLRRTAAFVFNSESTARVWNDQLPIRCPQCVIYNGIPTEPDALERALQAPPMSPFTLLTVARMAPIKSIETQVRALAILRRRGASDVRLIVVGDGPHRSAVEAEARREGVDDFVSFEGFQGDPRRYHARAHAYLCTSYNETFGLTLGDAMLSGMVCIAGCVGGPSELIEDGQSGFLVPCTMPPPDWLKDKLPPRVFDHTTGRIRAPLGVDPEALADKIAEVRRTFDTLTPLRDAARRRIVERFSVDRYCRSLDDLYDTLG